MTRTLKIVVGTSITAIALSASTGSAASPPGLAPQRSPAHEQLSTFVNAARSTATAGADAIAYFRANELATLRDSAGPASVAYFEANERATMGAGSYVGLTQSGKQTDESTPLLAGDATATGFDWGDAAIGATSAAMIALLIGGTFFLVRHTRGRELAR